MGLIAETKSDGKSTLSNKVTSSEWIQKVLSRIRQVLSLVEAHQKSLQRDTYKPFIVDLNTESSSDFFGLYPAFQTTEKPGLSIAEIQALVSKKRAPAQGKAFSLQDFATKVDLVEARL